MIHYHYCPDCGDWWSHEDGCGYPGDEIARTSWDAHPSETAFPCPRHQHDCEDVRQA